MRNRRRGYCIPSVRADGGCLTLHFQSKKKPLLVTTDTEDQQFEACLVPLTR